MSNVNLVFLFATASLLILAGHISQSYILDPESIVDADLLEKYNSGNAGAVLRDLPGSEPESAAVKPIGAAAVNAKDLQDALPLYIIGRNKVQVNTDDDDCAYCDGRTEFECKTICKEYGLKKSQCLGCNCLCKA